MKVDDVKAIVAQIRTMADDDEVAHSMEDRLHADVLQAIADGDDDAANLARAALETTAIDFDRWCA